MESTEELWLAAEEHRTAGRWTEAIAAYSRFLDVAPTHVSARLYQSDCLLASGQYRAAVEHLMHVLASDPERADHLYALFARLRNLSLIREMADCAARPALLESRHPGHLADVGTSLSLHGRLALARAFLDKAIAAVGEDAPLVYSRARANEFAGDFDEAERDLRKVLAQKPTDAFAHWSLSRLPSTHRRGDDAAALCKAAEQVEPGSRDDAVLHYALFNHLDRAGEIENAWRSLERACRVMASRRRYDAAASERLFRGLSRWPVPSTAAPSADSSGPQPIFIVGMHRTGTTLMESLLGAHPAIANASETYDFPLQLRWACDRHFQGACDERVAIQAASLDYGEIGRRYIERIRWHAEGKPFVTDKLPMNYLNIGAILSALPGARVVHMVRHPMDTCFSNLKEGFAGVADYSYQQESLADFFARYRRLMRHWHALFPGRILDIAYEDLVLHPKETSGRVLVACGLPATDATTDRTRGAVTTASSAQVRGDISGKNIGAWKRYALYLEPLKRQLQAAGEAID